MAHSWRDIDPKQPLGPRTRQCIRCGAIQERATDYLWGRVTAYRWQPKAGRCSTDKKSPSEQDETQRAVTVLRVALTKISDRTSERMRTKAAMEQALDDIGTLAADALADPK